MNLVLQHAYFQQCVLRSEFTFPLSLPFVSNTCRHRMSVTFSGGYETSLEGSFICVPYMFKIFSLYPAHTFSTKLPVASDNAWHDTESGEIKLELFC